MAHGIDVLLCTRNHAEALRQTLEVLSRCEIPPDVSAQIRVVDNGSTDETHAVITALEMGTIRVHYSYEAEVGLAHARNRGIKESTAHIILCTDDDIRPPKDWIDRMCRPLLDGEADAVAGGVRLAPDLVRPWMTSMHRGWLADTTWFSDAAGPELVGANMAVSRRVFETVPGFDVNVGAGALGFAEESLFAWQLAEAGYRIVRRPDVVVEHWPDPSRLSRESFLTMAKRFGQTRAYLAHHWSHDAPRASGLDTRLRWIRLMLKRLIHSAELLRAEGPPEWELNLVRDLWFHRQLQIEQERPRLYSRRGLRRLEPDNANGSPP